MEQSYVLSATCQNVSLLATPLRGEGVNIILDQEDIWMILLWHLMNHHKRNCSWLSYVFQKADSVVGDLWYFLGVYYHP